jgi:hypothetical protein
MERHQAFTHDLSRCGTSRNLPDAVSSWNFLRFSSDKCRDFASSRPWVVNFYSLLLGMPCWTNCRIGKLNMDLFDTILSLFFLGIPRNNFFLSHSTILYSLATRTSIIPTLGRSGFLWVLGFSMKENPLFLSSVVQLKGQ